uniref:Desulfoferrodoxin N-terminal domain-containing protein n=1 Tax=candidate division WOR-3 bacterium TaxID=2052148 RepID=A0A7V4E3E6_UNCW3
MAKKTKKRVVKKTVKKRVTKKATTPKGPVYVCSVCGAEIMVTKECNCEACDFICCGQPMTKKE